MAGMVYALLILFGGVSCNRPIIPDGTDDPEIPGNFGTLEVDFELPFYKDIQKGIRRVDLAVCNTMDEMYIGKFFYRANVSDVKEYYQINLPEGTYYYQATITCTCLADSCIDGGFPYGYGGLKYAFDEVTIEKGKKTTSKPSFQ
jgi:hypothetical protein